MLVSKTNFNSWVHTATATASCYWIKCVCDELAGDLARTEAEPNKHQVFAAYCRHNWLEPKPSAMDL